MCNLRSGGAWPPPPHTLINHCPQTSAKGASNSVVSRTMSGSQQGDKEAHFVSAGRRGEDRSSSQQKDTLKGAVDGTSNPSQVIPMKTLVLPRKRIRGSGQESMIQWNSCCGWPAFLSIALLFYMVLHSLMEDPEPACNTLYWRLSRSRCPVYNSGLHDRPMEQPETQLCLPHHLWWKLKSLQVARAWPGTRRKGQSCCQLQSHCAPCSMDGCRATRTPASPLSHFYFLHYLCPQKLALLVSPHPHMSLHYICLPKTHRFIFFLFI